jgi:hypothetical protein
VERAQKNEQPLTVVAYQISLQGIHHAHFDLVVVGILLCHPFMNRFELQVRLRDRDAGRQPRDRGDQGM